jgi:nucleotide-binding universal stress UspA family protein
MSETPNIIDAEIVPPKQGRRGDGGTYLVVADDTDEFRTALYYACIRARQNRARVGVLHIGVLDDFQQWGAVEERMKRELREQSEKYLWTVAKMANDINGTIPSLYIGQGLAEDVLLETIANDERIVTLMLGGKSGPSPGPLVSFCIGKGLERMHVPVVVVPSHIKEFG